MSVTVDIEYPTEDKVESAGLTGQSRQSHQNLLGRRRSVLVASIAPRSQSPTVSIKHLLAKPSGRRSWATPPPSRRFIDSMLGACTPFVFGWCATRSRPKI